MQKFAKKAELFKEVILSIIKEILTPEVARAHVDELGALRIEVFADFPYLYDGNLDYEKRYLETYFKASSSIVGVVADQGKFVGMTTGISLWEEEQSFQRPFLENSHQLNDYFYLGESLLTPEYRSRGFGKWFMNIRLQRARELGHRYACFCRVVRDKNDPRRGGDYVDLDGFWKSLGFRPMNMTTTYSWKEFGEQKESAKTMEFWRLEL